MMLVYSIALLLVAFTRIVCGKNPRGHQRSISTFEKTKSSLVEKGGSLGTVLEDYDYGQCKAGYWL
jgi:hypothetical protein